MTFWCWKANTILSNIVTVVFIFQLSLTYFLLITIMIRSKISPMSSNKLWFKLIMAYMQDKHVSYAFKSLILFSIFIWYVYNVYINIKNHKVHVHLLASACLSIFIIQCLFLYDFEILNIKCHCCKFRILNVKLWVWIKVK